MYTVILCHSHILYIINPFLSSRKGFDVQIDGKEDITTTYIFM